MMLKNKFKKYFNHSTVKYLIVGFSSFFVDYSILNIFYYVIHLGLGLSTTVGFFSGFLVSFISNRQWTFGHIEEKRNPKKQLVEYIILVLINYLFTYVSIKYLNKLDVQPWISKIAIMGLITVWNYVIFSKIIFTDKK